MSKAHKRPIPDVDKPEPLFAEAQGQGERSLKVDIKAPILDLVITNTNAIVIMIAGNTIHRA
jgi:hypothetical protein